MALFKNKNNQPQDKNKILEKAQKHGTDKRIYGDLIYKCRRCGYEGRMENIPNCDKVAWALMNGNRSHVFMSTNFYFDEETQTLYQDCMHHECDQGKYGYMELIGADIKGQIFLADKYKKQTPSTSPYNPDDELPLDDILNN